MQINQLKCLSQLEHRYDIVYLFQISNIFIPDWSTETLHDCYDIVGIGAELQTAGIRFLPGQLKVQMFVNLHWETSVLGQKKGF